MSGLHARFGFSGAHRWMECAGALLLEEGKKDDSSDFADLGTAAHHLHAHCLTTNNPARKYLGCKIWVTHDACDWAPGAVPIDAKVFPVDEDMVNAVQASLNHVHAVALPGALMLIEQRLDFSKILGIKDQFSTGDVGIANFESRNLFIGDYKHGTGERVDASYPDPQNPDARLPNHQLAGYAGGWLELLEMTGFEPETITLCVMQPRQDHIDEYTMTVEALKLFLGRAYNKANVISQLTTADVLKREPGTGRYGYRFLNPDSEKTCTWCKARAECPALAAKVAEASMADMTAIDEGRGPAMAPIPARNMSDEVLGYRYAMLDQIAGWMKDVKTEAERRVFAGGKIIGKDGQPMKVVEGKKGNRTWADEESAAGALSELIDVEKVYEKPKIIGITKAEALVGKTKFAKACLGGVPDEGIEPGPLFGHVTQSPGGPTIALGSDKRGPYGPDKNLEGTATEFAAIE